MKTCSKKFTLLLVLIAVFLGLASQVRFTEDISRFLSADKTNERINRTIENTGYGEFALLLALVKKKLQIIAVEPDDDKRELAENCASVPPNLRYIARIS